MSEIKRVRYFQNEFLDAVDFQVEQEYHREMRYLHTRNFHTWGLAQSGLEVKKAEHQESGAETKVVIYPGAALDGEGHEIVLTQSRLLDFAQPRFEGGKSYYIIIRWQEQPGLPRQENEHKRWMEIPVIDAVEQMPVEPGIEIVLAKVTLRNDANKTIEAIDGAMRRYAAMAIGDKTVTFPKLSEETGQSLVPVGGVLPFAMEAAPNGWLECNGQAVGRVEYERLFNKIGTAFGAGNGESTFNVPDLRGRFVRGWAHGSENDLDRDGRKPSAAGSADGDRVGSFQEDSIQTHLHSFVGTNKLTEGNDRNHIHNYSVDIPEGGGTTGGGPRWSYYQGYSITWQTHQTSNGHLHYFTPEGNITEPGSANVAAETRPKNIYLMYCIKY
jgi:microcystin-dependent protein